MHTLYEGMASQRMCITKRLITVKYDGSSMSHSRTHKHFYAHKTAERNVEREPSSHNLAIINLFTKHIFNNTPFLALNRQKAAMAWGRGNGNRQKRTAPPANIRTESKVNLSHFYRLITITLSIIIIDANEVSLFLMAGCHQHKIDHVYSIECGLHGPSAIERSPFPSQKAFRSEPLMNYR